MIIKVVVLRIYGYWVKVLNLKYVFGLVVIEWVVCKVFVFVNYIEYFNYFKI